MKIYKPLYAIGTDIVKIARFERWECYNKRQLSKIFNDSEIDAFQTQSQKILCEKIAVRFAAKEALYKALCSLIVYNHLPIVIPPFLTVCKKASIIAGMHNVPHFMLDQTLLNLFLAHNLELATSVSLSHEKEYAIASTVCSAFQHV